MVSTRDVLPRALKPYLVPSVKVGIDGWILSHHAANVGECHLRKAAIVLDLRGGTRMWGPDETTTAGTRL